MSSDKGEKRKTAENLPHFKEEMQFTIYAVEDS